MLPHRLTQKTVLKVEITNLRSKITIDSRTTDSRTTVKKDDPILEMVDTNLPFKSCVGRTRNISAEANIKEAAVN